ncbi:MAG: DUF4843 domain-containing protein [Bacteroidetes bacterium]|nr:DUF4843 domain-containing protein [Bacteroidota bacterium]
MKNLKYILIFLLSIGIFNSCLIDNETNVEDNDAGPNFAGFEDPFMIRTGIADGSEYAIAVKVKLTGPTHLDVTNDITVTIGVDQASSTAVEGTHYRIDNPTITLTAENNHLGLFELTMLTDGIVAPLDESPVVVLEVVSASGDNNVINNGKKIDITLNYACPSDLAGDYSVVTVRDDGAYNSWTETITEIGVGHYKTQYVGLWDTPLNPDYGFDFLDVCDKITVPLQDLAGGLYSNDVYGHAEGNVDPVTGVITIMYTIEFTAGNSEYTAVYTPL